MGPIFPEANFNLVLALIIGFIFGVLLEQAGFSSNKKLVGIFYGYDFTVWRVFFTAAITAMVGVLTLSHFNLLDISLIYISPMYLWSVVAGGIIMGFGFILGGYCPGTSLCAAAIGKLDAMVFILGVALGVFVFIVGYPMFEGIYLGSFMGAPQIFDLLNISMGLFTFIIVIFAFLSYWGVGILERKINNGESYELTSKSGFFKIFALATVVAFVALFMSPYKQTLLADFNSADFGKDANINLISSDDIAVRLLKNDNSLQFIDLRLPNEFAKLALPYALNATPEEFFLPRVSDFINQKQKITVIYGGDEKLAKKVAVLAVKIGFNPNKILVLKGGFNEFMKDIINFEMPKEQPNSSILKTTYLFRHEYNGRIKEILENSKPKQIVLPKSKRALGGCG